MDGSALAWPAFPDVCSDEGQHQLNILLSIRRIVFRRGLLAPDDERIIGTVSRSGYAVWWSSVRQQVFSVGSGDGCF